MSLSNDHLSPPPAARPIPIQFASSSETETGLANFNPHLSCNIVSLRESKKEAGRRAGPSWLLAEKSGRGELVIHSSLALAAVAMVVFFFQTTCEFSKNIDQIARHFTPAETIMTGKTSEPTAESTLTNVTGNVSDPVTAPGGTNIPPAAAMPVEAVPMPG